MDSNNEKAMKYFILFTIGSALLLPFGYEIYANLSRTFAWIILSVWVIAAGVKFSRLPLKNAMLGITSFVFSSVVMSVIGYLAIHPAVRSWIERHSEYFELTLAESLGYWYAAFLSLFAVYIVFFAALGVKKAVIALISEPDSVTDAVDNAFADSENSDEGGRR